MACRADGCEADDGGKLDVPTAKTRTNRRVLCVEQREAVALLCAGWSHRDVADKLRLSVRTIAGWVGRNPLFRSELDRSIRMQDSAREALLEITQGRGGAGSMGRLKAALAILGLPEPRAPIAHSHDTEASAARRAALHVGRTDER